MNVALFRVAQDALQNVSRHSGAAHAWVTAEMSGATVRLTVRDDGCGFDVAEVGPGHFGLAMMRERGEVLVRSGLEVAIGMYDDIELAGHAG